VLGPLALSLAGCTASWRAPVETRGHKPPPPRTLVNSSEYRVQRGDTLYGIAWQRGVDYRLLAAWNGIRPPYRIYAGQTLRLKPPPPVRRPPPAPPTSKARPRPSPTTKPAPKPPSKPPAPTPPPAATQQQQLAWRWPAAGRVVSGFDAADPLRKGIKIGGRIGQTIAAAESGRVVYSGSGLIGYGRLIIVKHNDKYLSAYGHNNAILVKEGDRVTKGQKIAEMGTANNGDPLLHFEIRRDGKPVDPVRLLPRR
jgi:lipoprotein NlpD